MIHSSHRRQHVQTSFLFSQRLDASVDRRRRWSHLLSDADQRASKDRSDWAMCHCSGAHTRTSASRWASSGSRTGQWSGILILLKIRCLPRSPSSTPDRRLPLRVFTRPPYTKYLRSLVPATSNTTMATLRASLLGTIYLLLLLAVPFKTLAQTISSPSYPEPSNNNPGGSSGPSDNPTPEDPNTAGASGDSKTAISLSPRDQIAIAVIVGLVVVVGITSAILFYLAKKRQWEVRASIRRSARRVTIAIKAKTPVRANFSKRDRGVMMVDSPHGSSTAEGNSNKERDRARRSGGILKDGKKKVRNEVVETHMDRDVEKGFGRDFGTRTKIEAGSAPAPRPLLSSSSSRPKSSFEMDSSLTGNRNGAHTVGKEGKAKGWLKMLGRK